MTNVPSDFADFSFFTAELGRDPFYAQGAGGNVSLKHDGVMWVKASGAWLKDAATKNIFVALHHAHAVTQLDQPVEPHYRRLDNNPDLRPSIETAVHAVLPHRVVVHVHAVNVMALAAQSDAARQCEEKLEGLNFAFLPYVKPGWPLAQALRRSLRLALPDIFILGNHGLIVGGKDVADVKATLATIDARLQAAARAALPPNLPFLERTCGRKWRLPKSAGVHALATDDLSRAYATGGTLYPDHVVFLGRGCDAVTEVGLAGADPAQHPMLLVTGKGVLLAASLPPAGEAMAECLAAVVNRIPPDAHLNYLSTRDEDDLLTWDAEKYRQTVQ